jgi:hypothetical protein
VLSVPPALASRPDRYVRCRGCGWPLAERLGEAFILREGRRWWVVDGLRDTACPNEDCASYDRPVAGERWWERLMRRLGR